MKAQDSLSQHEIDALLDAVHSGALAVTPGGGTAGPSATMRYNFRRPSRVSKDQMRGLHILHEDFAKLASGSLSSMMRTLVDVELEAVEQTAYNEYVQAIQTPTCAFVFNMEPLKGGAVLEINPQIAFAMIDRLLGGPGRNLGTLRDFTEIERAVIERTGLRCMVDLQQAWQQVGAFILRILMLETNAQFIQVTAPTEVVVVATFQVKIGEVVGGLTIAYPYLLLESSIPRLGAQRWAAAAVSDPTPENQAFVLREISQSMLTLRAFLGESQLSVREVLNLHPGQLVPVSAHPEKPVRVEISTVPKFVGRPGTHRKHLAVEITGHAERSPEA